jgi:hypothetical protein
MERADVFDFGLGWVNSVLWEGFKLCKFVGLALFEDMLVEGTCDCCP